ncbi:hypothetical protein SUDANB176_06123 [Streptomyces sp. enrichment culture]|uniref:hypothetical protein n=1 Tax=Streptomyces sp. enrichment culture TaxID=1795815 RepID=UPI003F558347
MAVSRDRSAAEPSLDEKTALLSGRDFWSTKPSPRAGIPSLVLSDGPHGVHRQRQDADSIGLFDSEPATCFPPAVALASGWDPALVGRVGAALGRETRALGVDTGTPAATAGPWRPGSLLQPLTLDSPIGDWFGHLVFGPTLTSAMVSGLTEEEAAAAREGNADALRLLSSMAMRQFLGFLPRQLPRELLEELMEISAAPGPADA